MSDNMYLGPNENAMAERGVDVMSLENLMQAAGMKEGAERDEYAEAAQQLEDMVILVGKGESFDCEILAEFKNIKTLAVVGMSSAAMQSPASQVVHLEALAEIPCLDALSLYNVETDLAGLAEFPSLRELYLTFCDIKEAFGFRKLPLLRELSIIGIEEAGIHVSWPDLWENTPELRYFNGYFVGVDSESIPDIFADGKGAEKLETLVLGCTGGPDEETFMNDILAQMPEDLVLKTLFLYMGRTNGTISLDQVKCNGSLENFFCNSRADHIAEFIDTHPGLSAVTVIGAPEMPDEESMAAYYNNIIAAAVKKADLSMLDIFWSLTIPDGSLSPLPWAEVRKRMDLQPLYQAGIYDDFLQLGAFVRNTDMETYYREQIEFLEKPEE